MTIAAGFVCSDGLLFASDTLYSGEQRRYGKKFWTSEWGATTVVFGGAGTQAGLLRTRDEIERRIEPTADRYVVIQAVEEALALVEEKLKPSDYERTEALIGIRTSGGYWLYENQGGRSMLSVVDKVSQCVGYGHSLGWYFADSLFKSGMTIEWAKKVAAHLVKQVKTYSSGYCGGRTHLVALPASGSVRFIVKKAEIIPLEEYLAEVHEAMQLVLPDKRSNDDTALNRVERFNETVRTLRKQFFLRVQPTEIKISSSVIATKITKPTDSE